MDEVTQQNSALVEEDAATAKTLEHQAKAMDERVAFFRLAEGAAAQKAARPAEVAAPAKAAAKPETAQRPAAAAPAKRGMVGRMQAAVATAFKKEPEWEEF